MPKDELCDVAGGKVDEGEVKGRLPVLVPQLEVYAGEGNQVPSHRSQTRFASQVQCRVACGVLHIHVRLGCTSEQGQALDVVVDGGVSEQTAVHQSRPAPLVHSVDVALASCSQQV